MEESTRNSAATPVRTRRAYFDCRFGQLHVRTAFPTTGGFDEGVTLFCVHPSHGSGRIFRRFLPEIAEDRPVYAPDLPGHGESDPVTQGALCTADAAGALLDLARDLRLRQIDVLGLRYGSAVAVELAAHMPDLVRRVVLIAVPPTARLPPVNQETLVLRIRVAVGDDPPWTPGIWPRTTFIDLPEPDIAMIGADAAPNALAKRIGAFLKA